MEKWWPFFALLSFFAGVLLGMFEARRRSRTSKPITHQQGSSLYTFRTNYPPRRTTTHDDTKN